MDRKRGRAYEIAIASGAAMIRFFFRVVGFFLLAGAFAALVIDGTRSIAGGMLSLTPLGTTIAWIAPTKFAELKPLIDHLNPFLWNPVMVHLLLLPTWLVIGGLGILIMALTQKRRPKIGYSSR
jgi:hypothetical protein